MGLMDFTHTWERDRDPRWQRKDPMPTVTAEMVNTWSLGGFGHDSINAYAVVRAKIRRQRLRLLCSGARARP